MKKLFLLLLLLLTGFHANAIEDLRLSVVGKTNVVLSWPSVSTETYIIQYRPSWDNTTPWTSLETAFPANQASNRTVYVHTNIVQTPTSPNISGSPGAPPPMLSAIQGSISGAAETKESKVKDKKPKKGELPPVPWDPQFVNQAPSTPTGFTSTFAALTPAQGGPDLGFYRVVRTGVSLLVTNGQTLSGFVQIPIEQGLPEGTASGGVAIVSETSDPQPFLAVSVSNRLSYVEWNTSLLLNGTYNLKPVVQVGDPYLYDLSGVQKSVTIFNPISFPNTLNVAGYVLEVQAKSIHNNGSYSVNVYDSSRGGNQIFLSLSGSTDSEGYITYGGYRGFRVDLTDVTGDVFPNDWYRVEVTTSPGITLFAASSSQVTSTNFVPTEPLWPRQAVGNPATAFAIGYMPMYGPPGNSSVGAVALQSMVQAVYTAAEVRPNGLGVVNGGSQNPYEIWAFSDMSTLFVNYLRLDYARNFYYFGHGGKDFLGTDDAPPNKPTGLMKKSDIEFILGNTGNPMKGGNKHPFRFVFTDACNTGSGDLCTAFGIPAKKNMKVADFQRAGMRARAFLGWKNYQVIGFGGIFDSQHALFVAQFFNAWQGTYPTGHPRAGQPRTLRDALELGARFGNPTAPLWNHYSDLVLYGAEDLLWEDTIP